MWDSLLDGIFSYEKQGGSCGSKWVGPPFCNLRSYLKGFWKVEKSPKIPTQLAGWLFKNPNHLGFFHLKKIFSRSGRKKSSDNIVGPSMLHTFLNRDIYKGKSYSNHADPSFVN